MQPRTSAHTLSQVCVLLGVLAMINKPVIGRPVNHNPPFPSDSSEQTITFSINGVAQNTHTSVIPVTGKGASRPKAGIPSSQTDPIFASQGPIGPSSSWLRTLTHPQALERGTVTVIDEEFHGAKEFGLPLLGKLQGVYVTSLTDGSSHMVAIKALFTGEDAANSLRFFGIQHDDRQESHIAVVGGTGRYDGATGFAVVKVADVPAGGGNDSLSKALSFRVYLK